MKYEEVMYGSILPETAMGVSTAGTLPGKGQRSIEEAVRA